MINYLGGECLMDAESDRIEREMQLAGEIPVEEYGFTFYLDKPIKYDVYNLLISLSTFNILRINGVDDIKPENEKSRFSLLRKIVEYAHYLDTQAYFMRKMA